MAKAMAQGMLNFAGDVWNGMAKGTNKGKAFRVKGGQTANRTIKKVNSANKNIKINKSKSIISKPGEHVGNFIGGGIRDTTKSIKSGQKFGTALKNAHSTNNKLDAKKIAGTYVGVSAASRIATGGGLLKDKNGNTNVIGIPFI